jgi:hypothetical protein
MSPGSWGSSCAPTTPLSLLKLLQISATSSRFRSVVPSVAIAAVLVEYFLGEYFTLGRDGLLSHLSFASLRGGEE